MDRLFLDFTNIERFVDISIEDISGSIQELWRLKIFLKTELQAGFYEIGHIGRYSAKLTKLAIFDEK